MKTYTGTQDARLREAGRETFEAFQDHARCCALRASANGAVYPRGRLGQSLQQVAQLIRADVGLEVAFAEMGGWDHHVNEKPQLDNQLLVNSARRWRHSTGTWATVCRMVRRDHEPVRPHRERKRNGRDRPWPCQCDVPDGSVVKGGRVETGFGLDSRRSNSMKGVTWGATTDFREVLSELCPENTWIARYSRAVSRLSALLTSLGLF